MVNKYQETHMFYILNQCIMFSSTINNEEEMMKVWQIMSRHGLTISWSFLRGFFLGTIFTFHQDSAKILKIFCILLAIRWLLVRFKYVKWIWEGTKAGKQNEKTQKFVDGRHVVGRYVVTVFWMFALRVNCQKPSSSVFKTLTKLGSVLLLYFEFKLPIAELVFFSLSIKHGLKYSL